MKGKSVCKIINESFSDFSLFWGKVLASIVLSLGSLLGLLLFPLFGLFLAFFSMGFICIGQKKFVLGLLNKKNLPVETVFSSFKISLQAFALKTIIILYSLLWSILLIIPGIICLLNYSFSSFIMAENEGVDAFSALDKSKSLVYGFRSKILILFLFSFLMFCVFGAVGFGVAMIVNLFAILPIWVIVVLTLGVAFFGLMLVVMPFYEISMAKLFIEAKTASVDKVKRKTKTV